MAELFYLIGASGVGKDSLLRYVRSRMDSDAPVAFAHRYITRPPDAGGENHVALFHEEFASRRGKGCFAMQWFSHHTWYAIGIEIDAWLARGINVVVNGSRAYLDEAVRRYPELVPVLVTAEYAALRKRLQERGRESAEQIERRLLAAERLDQGIEHPRLYTIDNTGPLAVAGEALLRLIQVERACG